MFQLSQSSKDNRKGIDPRLIDISDFAITISLVDFGHGKDAGLRTADRQYELYQKGVSAADGVNHLSKHQLQPGADYGTALDFYAYVGKASWDHTHLAMVACAFFQAAAELGHSIEWGGLWEGKSPTVINDIPYGWDCPHIQLIGV